MKISLKLLLAVAGVLAVSVMVVVNFYVYSVNQSWESPFKNEKFYDYTLNQCKEDAERFEMCIPFLSSGPFYRMTCDHKNNFRAWAKRECPETVNWVISMRKSYGNNSWKYQNATIKDCRKVKDSEKIDCVLGVTRSEQYGESQELFYMAKIVNGDDFSNRQGTVDYLRKRWAQKLNLPENTNLTDVVAKFKEGYSFLNREWVM
ncbi:MAG: hypothetical protein NT091_04425 [Candidatus Falkowbacteria bacterium]|nr:hypothetical protein [Candidatus Falkowbacteria bacterium]